MFSTWSEEIGESEKRSGDFYNCTGGMEESDRKRQIYHCIMDYGLEYHRIPTLLLGMQITCYNRH